ncbi:MAG: hypothetical protein RSA74_07420, partial [Chryseobacterium sp.]
MTGIQFFFKFATLLSKRLLLARASRSCPQNYSGYPDTSGSIIGYDLNGNMTSHQDKGILEIRYNHL